MTKRQLIHQYGRGQDIAVGVLRGWGQALCLLHVQVGAGRIQGQSLCHGMMTAAKRKTKKKTVLIEAGTCRHLGEEKW